uniref:Uncharacterized protein n=1 Tax=Aegilops tauschii TaxID=37682 RepID=M8C1G0_AEGTA
MASNGVLQFAVFGRVATFGIRGYNYIGKENPWLCAVQIQKRRERFMFFLSHGEPEGSTILEYGVTLAPFVYSSTTRQWRDVASKECNELLLGQGESTMVSPIDRRFYGRRHYAYGCFYWESTVMGKKDLLVFDTRRMEFSSCDLPPKELCPLGLAIVEAGEARLGLFGIHLQAGKFDLCYYIKGNKCESSTQWQLEKTIPICSGCRPDIKAATWRYLLLGKFGPMRFVDSVPHQDLDYISVDVKTLELARVCTKSSGFAFSKTWIYTNFPPSLSSPKI